MEPTFRLLFALTEQSGCIDDRVPGWSESCFCHSMGDHAYGKLTLQDLSHVSVATFLCAIAGIATSHVQVGIIALQCYDFTDDQLVISEIGTLYRCVHTYSSQACHPCEDTFRVHLLSSGKDI